MLLLSLPALLLIAASLSAQVQGAPVKELAGQQPAPKVLGVEVTYLANEGFVLRSGKYSVLIDAFVREPVGEFAALPLEVHRDLANARPPYDGLTITLVSHDHPDHVQWRGLEKFLGKNDRAQLISAPQILKGFRDAAQEFETIAPRVLSVPIVRGAIKTLMQEEMSIEFFSLEHRGRNERIFNLGHLIDMGGLRLLHVGDAEATAENFAAYGLGSKDIDVAFVPYWFFGTPASVKLLFEDIHPRFVVACHVPPSEMNTFGPLLAEQFPDVVLFTQPLETRTFEPRSDAPSPSPRGDEEGDEGG